MITALPARRTAPIFGCVLAHVLVFFYVYSVRFSFSPIGIGTRVWLGIFGLIAVLYFSMVKPHLLRMRRIDATIVALLTILAVVSLISLAANSTQDYAFVVYFPSMVTVALGAFIVAVVVQLAYKSDPWKGVCTIIVNVVTLQAVLALFRFLFPSLRDAMMAIEVSTDIENAVLEETLGFRLTGFGAQFFGAGIANSLALILIGQKMRLSKLSTLEIVTLSLSFVLVTCLGMMMSRTTLIGAALATLMIILPEKSTDKTSLDKRKKHLTFWLATAVIPLIGVLVLVLSMPEWYASVEPAIRFGFEIFIKYFEGGTLESESTTQLMDMYRLEGALPFFFGDGYYSDPSDPSGYYKAIDIGYFRLIYYFGLPGLLTYLAFQLSGIYAACKYVPSGRLLAYSMTAFLLIANFKGFTDVFYFSVLLYMVKRLSISNAVDDGKRIERNLLSHGLSDMNSKRRPASLPKR